jgi:hypothetical protein
MTAALLQTDDATGCRWLSFPSMPPARVRSALVRAGWRYHGGHRAWHHDDAAAPIPPGFAVGRGGTCLYSTIRPVQGAAILELLARTRAQIARRDRLPA